eukprot:2475116-Amphidinium_carterae.1
MGIRLFHASHTVFCIALCQQHAQEIMETKEGLGPSVPEQTAACCSMHRNKTIAHKYSRRRRNDYI